MSFRRFRVAKKDAMRRAIYCNNKIITNIKLRENKIFDSLNLYKKALQVGSGGTKTLNKVSTNYLNPKFKIALDEYLINRYFGNINQNTYNLSLKDVKEIISLHKFQRSFLRKQKFPKKLIIYDK